MTPSCCSNVPLMQTQTSHMGSYLYYIIKFHKGQTRRCQKVWRCPQGGVHLVHVSPYFVVLFLQEGTRERQRGGFRESIRESGQYQFTVFASRQIWVSSSAPPSDCCVALGNSAHQMLSFLNYNVEITKTRNLEGSKHLAMIITYNVIISES